MARDLSRIIFPCVLWCVVFRRVAQSAFILLVCYCLSHTTKGSFCNISKIKNGQHLLDYRCCPLKLCFDPFSDRIKESDSLFLFWRCVLLRLFKILAGRVHIEFKATPHNGSCGLRRIFCPNRAVWKMGNTSSISAFSILSLGSKSLAESPCPIMRCCLNFPKLLRILPDGFELGIGFGMLLFQSGIRNFRNEKSWIPVALWSSY